LLSFKFHNFPIDIQTHLQVPAHCIPHSIKLSIPKHKAAKLAINPPEGMQANS